jgi:hypothetical protein
VGCGVWDCEEVSVCENVVISALRAGKYILNLGKRQNFTNSLKTGLGGTGILACVVFEYRFKPHRQEFLCHQEKIFVVYYNSTLLTARENSIQI